MIFYPAKLTEPLRLSECKKNSDNLPQGIAPEIEKRIVVETLLEAEVPSFKNLSAGRKFRIVHIPEYTCREMGKNKIQNQTEKIFTLCFSGRQTKPE